MIPWDTMLEVLTLQQYNTRLVVLSTALLGLASGILGGFLLMRKRSLLGDSLSHATLPGIALAFMLMVLMGGTGKFLPGLLMGAMLTGLAGVGLVLLIRNTTRIKDDAAMGIVLSVFFGAGIVLLGIAQDMPGAGAAGLEQFIYGRTASMVLSDFFVIAGVTIASALATCFLFKEFSILCFDEDFARAQGWPVHRLDMIMLALVAAVTVTGLQAVGLILIIAFLITPAAAARFWTDQLKYMLWIASCLGAISGWFGSSISALLPGWPAGAVIVLTATFIFLFSMIFGSARGVLPRYLQHIRLKKRIGRQHMLRGIFELLENEQTRGKGRPPANSLVDLASLQSMRTWSKSTLDQLIRQGLREDHIDYYDGHSVRLSESGFGEAARMTRNHRLWEAYLMAYADVAPQHVDRDADMVEHVLSPEIIRQLEHNLPDTVRDSSMPASPHQIKPAEGPA